MYGFVLRGKKLKLKLATGVGPKSHIYGCGSPVIGVLVIGGGPVECNFRKSFKYKCYRTSVTESWCGRTVMHRPLFF